MLKDMIPHFELFQPDNVDTAFDLLDRYGSDGWLLAGGYDSLDWFKDRVQKPTAVIDLAGINTLHGVHATADGLENGSMTTLTEVERHPIVREKFTLLADAARHVATPQIRNSGTLGGNISQDTRCWYYRYGLSCYRAGGNICYADAPDSQNREHCVFGADRCVAVTPSDTAPALVALDASMVVRNRKGEQVIKAEDFFMKPGVDITRMTVMKPDDILTTIRIPNTWAGSKFYFEKVADRNSWDFALVSVASAMKLSGGTIQDTRVVCGGVQCIPRRLSVVEKSVIGNPPNEDTAERAATLAVANAKPLKYNGFKIPLMHNLVKRAIRDT